MVLKIAFVLHNLDIGGAERLTVELSRELSSLGCQCEIITVLGTGPLKTLIPSGVALQPYRFFPSGHLGKLFSFLFGPVFFVTGLVRLSLHLRRSRPDVLQTSLWMGDILGVLSGRLAGVRAIISVQHDVIRSAARRKKFALKWATKVVAISKAVETFLKDELRVPSEKIVTIHNGIDPDFFVSCRRPTRYPPRLAVIGRLHPLKGQRVLLEALAILKSDPPISCFLIGSGPDEPYLRRRISELKVENVKILPPTTDIRPALQESDVVVAPSLTEGLGLSLLEAMAAEKVIVASRVGGITDLLIDRVNALLVPPNDPIALCQALSFILKNPREAVLMARNAHQSLLDRPEFTLKGMSIRYLALYKDLVGSKT